MNQAIKIAEFSKLKDRKPEHRLVSDLDLVLVKYDKHISVFYGRCHHRGALLGDGYVAGDNLMCGLHHWDYRLDTGVSEYNNAESLYKFTTEIKDDIVYVDEEEVEDFLLKNPQPFNREAYLGQYADTHPEDTEPYTASIQKLAKEGLTKVGHHGASAAMGVDRNTLPKWEDIQFLPAQLSSKPLMDEDKVETRTVIGAQARKPLVLNMPIFVSDMSFGAISKEAKIALAMGAENAGTGICSGEGGMLSDEQEANSRYFYELASGKFGFQMEKLSKVQAFHFKGGQGAKTGTGGHLPGNKVTADIAEVRGLKKGEDAISPATFPDLKTVQDFKELADQIREHTGGIPIGFKLGASHIEKDIAFALEASADYIILDGRGGATGAAPTILRDNINVPTIPALARARKFLNDQGVQDVQLVITGGLRLPADFAKALMLGADAVAIANSAIQAIGCLGMRACATNNCPVGIATQKKDLRSRLIIEESARQLTTFLCAANDLVKVVARSCGYDDISKFAPTDLSTFNFDMHKLTGISYAGIG